MNGLNSRGLGVLAGLGALCLTQAPAPAQAHISLERGGTHKSRYGEANQKEGVCGRVNGKRGTNIYTYEPGQTITVKVAEFVPHPSYYRVAFDNDGDDGFLDPRSIKPIDSTRRCPYNEWDQCGKSDFYNNETVLPGLDNIYPHRRADAKTLTIEVKLPNVECDNCTLQVIQVMEDTVHGAYNTSPENPDGSLEDVYHQCIDLVLKRKPGSKPPAAAVDASTPKPDAQVGDGGVVAPETRSADGGAGKPLASVFGEEGKSESEEAEVSEGCSLSSSPSSTQSVGWLLLALGALVSRSRKRGA